MAEGWSPPTEGRDAPLWAVLKRLPSDFEPYGQRSRDEEDGADCSCGCRWFLPLEGERAADWGVCANPVSPRAGLLTWEHQGCPVFELDQDLDAEDRMAEWPRERVPLPGDCLEIRRPLPLPVQTAFAYRVSDFRGKVAVDATLAGAAALWRARYQSGPAMLEVHALYVGGAEQHLDADVYSRRVVVEQDNAPVGATGAGSVRWTRVWRDDIQL